MADPQRPYQADRERDAEMLALHAQGATNVEIARVVGMTTQGVKYALARLGVQGRLGAADPERDAAIWSMHVAGETLQAIASGVGMTTTGVKGALLRIGKRQRAIDRELARAAKRAALDGQGSDDLVTCLICGQRCRSVGHHVRGAHGMAADEYRDRFDIRRGQSLTAPASRQRWQESIADELAAGRLGPHHARGHQREAAAMSALVKRRLREGGATFRPSRPPKPRELLVTIVAAIEGGETRAAAFAAAGISQSGFYHALRRHPDLRERLAAVFAARQRRAV